MEKKFSTQFVTRVALLSVIAYVLMLINTPLPMFASHLKIDISDVPCLLAALSMGPTAAVVVQFIKNLLNLLISTTTGGVGEMANFFVGLSLVLPFALIYKKIPTKKGYIIAGIISVIFMVVVAVLMNYYVSLPLYGMHLEPDALRAYMLFSVVPFNVLKGFLSLFVGFYVYKYLKPVLTVK